LKLLAAVWMANDYTTFGTSSTVAKDFNTITSDFVNSEHFDFLYSLVGFRLPLLTTASQFIVHRHPW
jgi:hypothetical protein